MTTPRLLPPSPPHPTMMRYLDISPLDIEDSDFPHHPHGRYISLDDLLYVMALNPQGLPELLHRTVNGERAPL